MGAEKIAFRGNRQKEKVQRREWSGGELTGDEEEEEDVRQDVVTLVNSK